jgi:hypothetical protein
MRTPLLGRPPARRRSGLTRVFSRVAATGALAAVYLLSPNDAVLRPEPPASLTDAEFWAFFTTMSEPGGTFLSENFVSNEVSFQEVIPALQRSLTPNGVYLGVGPEQNFTYIANLRPGMAVIFDIRRQNAMHHLMYKALFEQSPTRAEFVERLFSRPMGRTGLGAKAAELFDSASAAAPSDSAYRTNRDAIVQTLTERHGFALSPDDVATIEHVYGVFYEAGPDVNYGYRPGASGAFGARYPTFGMLQAATNADSVPMAFLASEENYRAVRDLHLRNLIVPVVGDFGGPKAIRAVGDYLRAREMTVTAFYVSNVEQYLFREYGAADRFYGNVAALPLDSTSSFIRSVPRSGAGGFSVFVNRVGGPPSGGGVSVGGVGGPPGQPIGVSVMDSGGVRILRLVYDSAGTQVVHTYRDSIPNIVARQDSSRGWILRRETLTVNTLRALAGSRDSTSPPPAAIGSPRPRTPVYMMNNLLSSGLASIRETLDASFAGQLKSYQDVIAMTKTRP